MTLTFDIILIAGLLWLAWRSLASPELFKGVVLFIAFGFLLALAWVRLNAPDVALAEAAIGSGLTGALFLSTLGRLAAMDRTTAKQNPTPVMPPTGRILGGMLAAGVVTVTAGLGWVVYTLPYPEVRLGATVRGQLEASGVSNPVTAVLLNFRAYDTLLEMGVLLLAVVAVWALARSPAGEAGSAPIEINPVQRALVNVLVPVMLVVAGYLLWTGASAPGGAFQAGAVLGGAGVLLILSRPAWPALGDGMWLRAALTAGLAVFLLAALLPVATDRALLEYPTGAASTIIIVIETAAMFSIGLTLALLFLGGRPAAAPPSQQSKES